MNNITTENDKIVSAFVFNPARSIFKQSRNERARSTTIICKLESCPLRDAETCMLASVIGGNRCPYGKIRTEIGPTKRAKKFSSWVNDRQSQYKGITHLGCTHKKMAFIGDYIYLPYAHVTMNKRVAFTTHSVFFFSGDCLLPLDSWTINTVISIIDFRPEAFMGGIISSYQEREIPLFLLHLREVDSKMWKKLIDKRPELNVEPNHIGRKAILQTLNFPIQWTTKHDKYSVSWKWNGKYLVTTSQSAYQNIWGEIPAKSISLTVVPKDNTPIDIQNNDWINKNTQFIN